MRQIRLPSSQVSFFFLIFPYQFGCSVLFFVGGGFFFCFYLPLLRRQLPPFPRTRPWCSSSSVPINTLVLNRNPPCSAVGFGHSVLFLGTSNVVSPPPPLCCSDYSNLTFLDQARSLVTPAPTTHKSSFFFLDPLPSALCSHASLAAGVFRSRPCFASKPALQRIPHPDWAPLPLGPPVPQSTNALLLIPRRVFR